MAYVSQEKKAKIAAALKLVVPKTWKYSLAVRNHSTIVMTIKAAPADLDHGKGHAQLNHYYLQDWLQGDDLKVMRDILDALNTDNHDNSDIQTDYFDVGHYISINIGRWNKPFNNTTVSA